MPFESNIVKDEHKKTYNMNNFDFSGAIFRLYNFM